MAAKIFSGAVTAQSVEALDEVVLKSLLLTAAAADATATLLSAGVAVYTIAAKAGTSVVAPGQNNPSSRIPLIAPVTITTTGAGAFTRVDY